MKTLKEYLSTNRIAIPAGSIKLKEPKCNVCKDIGLIGLDVPFAHEKFGRLYPCPNCQPDHYELDLESTTGLVKTEREMNWKDVADINNAIEAVEAVKSTLERGYGWVFLWGNCGLAKTLILQIAIAESLRASKDAKYIRMVEVIDNLKTAFDKKDSGSDENRKIETWSNLPVLAIDEFEKINETDWASNRRFLLLDRRYQEAIREKSITIFASNQNPEHLEEYLASRVYDNRFKVVHLIGADVRKSMTY